MQNSPKKVPALKKISLIFTASIGVLVLAFYLTKGLVINQVNQFTQKSYLITTAIDNYELGFFR
jgi:hypothetical protein